MKTSKVNYFGYEDCLRLENSETRATVCPLAGGRVLAYAYQGVNAIYLNQAQEGWRYQAGIPPVDPCGGRFDVGPERVITPHPDLWLGDWTGEIVGEDRIRLTSQRDRRPRASGWSADFTLAADSSRLACEQRIINESDKPSPAAIGVGPWRVVVAFAALLADFGVDVFDEIQLSAVPVLFAHLADRCFAVTEFTLHRATPSHRQ